MDIQDELSEFATYKFWVLYNMGQAGYPLRDTRCQVRLQLNRLITDYNQYLLHIPTITYGSAVNSLNNQYNQ